MWALALWKHDCLAHSHQEFFRRLWQRRDGTWETIQPGGPAWVALCWSPRSQWESRPLSCSQCPLQPSDQALLRGRCTPLCLQKQMHPSSPSDLEFSASENLGPGLLWSGLVSKKWEDGAGLDGRGENCARLASSAGDQDPGNEWEFLFFANF